jgi:hypothetical protein
MDEKTDNTPARASEDFHLRIAAAYRSDEFRSVAFSPDRRFIASGFYDKIVKL